MGVLRTFFREAGALVLVVNVVGLLAAAVVMYAAWQHNPQGEFHDVDGVRWFGWGAIGVFWWAAVGGAPSLFVLAVWMILRWRGR